MKENLFTQAKRLHPTPINKLAHTADLKSITCAKMTDYIVGPIGWCAYDVDVYPIWMEPSLEMEICIDELARHTAYGCILNLSSRTIIIRKNI